MRMLKLALAAVAALLTLSTVSAPAEAHGRARGGVYLHFGVPYPYYWGPRYYYYPPPPVYYYPPPVVVERAPPTYIERDDEDSQTWWYWCADAKKYYPYVKECPGGWQRVPPQPSN